MSEAKKLSSYFHFREPVELKNKTLLEKADLDPSLDFMDSLEHDIPKGKSLLLQGRGLCLQARAGGHAPAILLREWSQSLGGEWGFMWVLEGGLPRVQYKFQFIVNSR